MSQHQHQHHILSEAAALRLLNGVVTTGNATPISAVPTSPPTPTPPSSHLVDGQRLEMPEASCSTELGGGGAAAMEMASPPTPNASTAAMEISAARLRMLPAPPAPQESVHSANEYGNSCRICRWNRSDMEIINCPCNCKGSVVSGCEDFGAGGMRFGFTNNSSVTLLSGLHPHEVPQAVDHAPAGQSLRSLQCGVQHHRGAGEPEANDADLLLWPLLWPDREAPAVQRLVNAPGPHHPAAGERTIPAHRVIHLDSIASHGCGLPEIHSLSTGAAVYG